MVKYANKKEGVPKGHPLKLLGYNFGIHLQYLYLSA